MQSVVSNKTQVGATMQPRSMGGGYQRPRGLLGAAHRSLQMEQKVQSVNVSDSNHGLVLKMTASVM
jgi:hypothetical protein